MAILFRCNSGKAWVGSGKPHRLQDGTVCLPGGRPIALGLALASGDPVVGQSDLIGWRTVTIRPEWVGRRIAVFTAMEVKRPDGGRTSNQQANFVTQVTRAGGIAGVVNSESVAQALLRDWVPPE